MSRWRVFPKREPIGVTMRRNRNALSTMVAPEHRERFEADFPESHLPALPKKRAPREPGVDIDVVHVGRDIEAPVLKAVGELLAVHPKILLAVRQNSGALPYERAGRAVPVWFYKFARRPEPMTLVDYCGFLKDGRPFAIECKRPGWKRPTTERENRQQAYMQMIAAIRGISGFVRSADEANALLA